MFRSAFVQVVLCFTFLCIAAIAVDGSASPVSAGKRYVVKAPAGTVRRLNAQPSNSILVHREQRVAVVTKPPIIKKDPLRPAPATSTAPIEGTPSSKTAAAWRTGEQLLAEVKLGASLADLHAVKGPPWLVAHSGMGITYWAYSVDADRAWFVATLDAFHRVVAVQVVQRNKAPQSTLRDAADSVLGEAVPTAVVDIKRPDIIRNDIVQFTEKAASTVHRFRAVDRRGRVFRFGLTSEHPELPPLIRWYANTGWSADRAILPSSYSSVGISKYLRALKEVPELRCGNGRHWLAQTSNVVIRDGVSLDAVKAACGSGHRTETIYFARTEHAPKPFDSDPIAQLMLVLSVINDVTFVCLIYIIRHAASASRSAPYPSFGTS